MSGAGAARPPATAAGGAGPASGPGNQALAQHPLPAGSSLGCGWVRVFLRSERVRGTYLPRGPTLVTHSARRGPTRSSRHTSLRPRPVCGVRRGRGEGSWQGGRWVRTAAAARREEQDQQPQAGEAVPVPGGPRGAAAAARHRGCGNPLRGAAEAPSVPLCVAGRSATARWLPRPHRPVSLRGPCHFPVPSAPGRPGEVTDERGSQGQDPVSVPG